MRAGPQEADLPRSGRHQRGSDVIALPYKARTLTSALRAIPLRGANACATARRSVPMSAKNNIIVLTHGWTGSSVFSALFGQAGYWLGGETVQKVDYNTYENMRLVHLNQSILTTLAPGLDHEHRFDPADLSGIDEQARTGALDMSPMCRFVEECDARSPWLWKDPRLTWTIRVWRKVIDIDRVAFLLLTREPLQAWVSSNLRRHIQSPSFTRAYNGGITQANEAFVRSTGRPFLSMSFEDLLLRPEDSLQQLNDTFGTAFHIADLSAVYGAPLRRRSRGVGDLAVASLIYLKNLHVRDGRGRRSVANFTPQTGLDTRR